MVLYSESRFLKLTRRIYNKAQRVCPAYSSKFSKKTYTQHQHITILCLRKWLKQDYRDTVELIAEMPRIQELLELEQILDYTTLCKAFERLSKLVFVVLLELTLPNGLPRTYGIDATGLTRNHVSSHYAKQCKIRIKSMKTTFLVNSDTQLIAGIHTTTTRKHDSKIILPVVGRSPHHIDTLIGDKGYDDNKVREALKSVGIKPVIPYRECTELDKLANCKLDKRTYSKRVFNETVNSSIKRKYGDELVSRHWRNQQKEVYLMCILHNSERLISVIWEGFQQSHLKNKSKIYKSICTGSPCSFSSGCEIC
jgi:IS5 family transposase